MARLSNPLKYVWHVITVVLPQRSQLQTRGYRRMPGCLVSEMNSNHVLRGQKQIAHGLTASFRSHSYTKHRKRNAKMRDISTLKLFQ